MVHGQSLEIIRLLENCADFIYGQVMQTENEGIRAKGVELVERINHILGYKLKGER
jgi:hypothetical protein